ncbi:hypothetical protein GW17_00037160 [Ensete ventricosum]|nr:hypothetical protein GW17_00037160 [Ensete ventricosum]
MAARQRHEMRGRKRSKKGELGVEKRVERRRGWQEGFSRKWKRESGARIMLMAEIRARLPTLRAGPTFLREPRTRRRIWVAWWPAHVREF